MAQVRITGWRPGLLKVSVTKAIRAHSELDLAEAKERTDSLLSGQTVIVDTPTARDPDELAQKLFSFGADAFVVEDQMQK